MMLKALLQNATANLFSAKVRSFLAVLGILVGTSSVVALIFCGQLAAQQALKQFANLGTDLLAVQIMPQQNDQPSIQKNESPLKKLYSLKTVRNVYSVAPYTASYAEFKYGQQKMSTSIIGVPQSLQAILKIRMQKGRFISFLDKRNFYAVIGSNIAQTLKDQGLYQPIGKQLYLQNNIVLTIVGVAAPWTANSFFGQEVNDSILIPIDASLLFSKYTQISDVIMQVNSEADVDVLQKSIEGKLQQLLPDTQIFIRSAKQLIEGMQQQQATLTLLLGLIGGISLFVGGIGVMNIMLVSISERKREIGIRKAIGARGIDIQLLFLSESVMLSLLGGILGVLLGVLGTYLVCLKSGWEFAFFMTPIVIGFSASVSIGIFFGFYPAYKASQLDPITCLRSD